MLLYYQRRDKKRDNKVAVDRHLARVCREAVLQLILVDKERYNNNNNKLAKNRVWTTILFYFLKCTLFCLLSLFLSQRQITALFFFFNCFITEKIPLGTNREVYTVTKTKTPEILYRLGGTYIFIMKNL